MSCEQAMTICEQDWKIRRSHCIFSLIRTTRTHVQRIFRYIVAQLDAPLLDMETFYFTLATIHVP